MTGRPCTETGFLSAALGLLLPFRSDSSFEASKRIKLTSVVASDPDYPEGNWSSTVTYSMRYSIIEMMP